MNQQSDKSPVSVRLFDLAEALEEAAEESDRTRSDQIRRYVREGLRQDGYLERSRRRRW